MGRYYITNLMGDTREVSKKEFRREVWFWRLMFIPLWLALATMLFMLATVMAELIEVFKGA